MEGVLIRFQLCPLRGDFGTGHHSRMLLHGMEPGSGARERDKDVRGGNAISMKALPAGEARRVGLPKYHRRRRRRVHRSWRRRIAPPTSRVSSGSANCTGFRAPPTDTVMHVSLRSRDERNEERIVKSFLSERKPELLRQFRGCGTLHMRVIKVSVSRTAWNGRP
jgi:hypothetical protein